MELRVLQYYLTVTREESISKAAERLHITQPTLSRQMKELEEEFGKQLFIRGNRKITLTDDGILLRQKAQEIVNLVEKTEALMSTSHETLSGDIYIGCGETQSMRIIAKVIKQIQQLHPLFKFHLYSGNAQDVSDRLDKGLLDFGIFIEPVNIQKYDYMKLPVYDRWGIYMRKDSPLAQKEKLTFQDIQHLPLICSNQDMVKNEIAGWIGGNSRKLNIIGTYNLVYNAALMVDEGVGYALSLDGLLNTTGESSLCFRPLDPQLEAGLILAWKKYQLLSKEADYFLTLLKENIHISQ